MTSPYDSSTTSAHAELISDLARTLPLDEGLTRILGEPAAAVPATVPAELHADAHQGLVNDLAAAMPPGVGLARILAAETGPAALRAELTAKVDVARGLAAILDVHGPGTDAGVTGKTTGESPDMDGALLAIYRSPDGQRLLLREGPAWPAVRDARRSLNDIRSLLARAPAVGAPRSSMLDLMPEVLVQQHARLARATTGLAQALRSGRPNVYIYGKGAVMGLVASMPLRIMPLRADVDIDVPRLSIDEYADGPHTEESEASVRADEPLEASFALQRLTMLAEEDPRTAAQEFSRLEKTDPTLRREAKRLAANNAALRKSLEILQFAEERDLWPQAAQSGQKVEKSTAKSEAPHDDETKEPLDVAQDDEPPGAATQRATAAFKLAQNLIHEGFTDDATDEAGFMPGTLCEIDRDVTRHVSGLVHEVAADLAELADQLRSQPPALAGERLLQRCTALVADLSVALEKLWAALSDFRGANLRDVAGVDRDDLDGVRWSDGIADTGATQWPDTLRDWVSLYSTAVDDTPGVFEIRFGTAVSTTR